LPTDEFIAVLHWDLNFVGAPSTKKIQTGTGQRSSVSVASLIQPTSEQSEIVNSPATERQSQSVSNDASTDAQMPPERGLVAPSVHSVENLDGECFHVVIMLCLSEKK